MADTLPWPDGSGGLPPPWSWTLVANPSTSGDASYAAGTFTLSSTGADIWYADDEFTYVYQSFNSLSGGIIARVVSVQNTGEWAKAGVMIRETLDPGSKHAMMLMTPIRSAFIHRTQTDGKSASFNGTSVSPPYWVKLVRSGHTFTGYDSSDGQTWNKIQEATITMSTSVHIGLALSAQDWTVMNTSTFDSVSVF